MIPVRRWTSIGTLPFVLTYEHLVSGLWTDQMQFQSKKQLPESIQFGGYLPRNNEPTVPTGGSRVFYKSNNNLSHSFFLMDRNHRSILRVSRAIFHPFTFVRFGFVFRPIILSNLSFVPPFSKTTTNL